MPWDNGRMRQDPALSSQGHAGEETRPTAEAGKETILVADDEREVRRLIASVLRMRGFKVLEAVDGDEALRVAARHAGPIHLLVADAVMPVLDGRELCRRARLQRPEMRLLLVSGDTTMELTPGLAFLPKPFRLADLLRAVEGALERGSVTP